MAAGAKHIVLYVWRDEFAAALDLVDHDVSCYHIDDEYSFDERDPPNSAAEIALLTRADQVIIHSVQLMRKKGAINRANISAIRLGKNILMGDFFLSRATISTRPSRLTLSPPPT